MRVKTAFAVAACAGCLLGQTPVAVLEVEIDNLVCYLDDIPDNTKKATSVAVAARASTEIRYRTFKTNLCLGDIVAVNGKPMKGYFVVNWTQVLATVALTPGRAIADTAGACPGISTYAILQPDGTPVGTIVGTGIAGSPIAPGAPAGTVRNNVAVVGGTGAFLGARGQIVEGPTVTLARAASMLEDPAYRRVNGGGKMTYFIQLLPMAYPTVLELPTGPAIYHSADFSLVSQDKPARAGEHLIVGFSGFGPVVPDLLLGRSFPSYQDGKSHALNSPVEVTVNGRNVPVVNKIGWPTLNNVYRVDFVVPEGIQAGMAGLGLSVAWINGPEVKFPVR